MTPMAIAAPAAPPADPTTAPAGSGGSDAEGIAAFASLLGAAIDQALGDAEAGTPDGVGEATAAEGADALLLGEVLAEGDDLADGEAPTEAPVDEVSLLAALPPAPLGLRRTAEATTAAGTVETSEGPDAIVATAPAIAAEPADATSTGIVPLDEGADPSPALASEAQADATTATAQGAAGTVTTPASPAADGRTTDPTGTPGTASGVDTATATATSATPAESAATAAATDGADGADGADISAATSTSTPDADAVDAPTLATGPVEPTTSGRSTGRVTAATGQPAVPTTPEPPATQVASAVAALRRRGDGEYVATLDLHPAELGRVRVELEVRAGVVNVTMTPEQAGTRALLTQGIEDLRAALEQGGLDAGQLDVSQQDHPGDQPQDQADQSGHPAGRPAGRPAGEATAIAVPLPTSATPTASPADGLDVRL